LLHMFGRQYG